MCRPSSRLPSAAKTLPRRPRLQRFPINVRYPRELRDSIEKSAWPTHRHRRGAQITLGTLAELAFVDGPAYAQKENARLSGWVVRGHARTRSAIGCVQ